MVAKTDRETLETVRRAHNALLNLWTQGQDRLLALTASMLELACDGKRSFEEICEALQLIKDRTDWVLELKLKKGNSAPTAPAFSRDMRKEGWTLIENVSRQITSITDPKLVPILKKGETSINGEEMVRRARAELNANLGQEDAEWLLEHQAEIPKEWRSYYLTFPGTVWQGEYGCRFVPCLRWGVAGWCLYFGWLGLDWLSGVRLLSVGKS